MNALAQLARRRVLVVTGKGGVGKTAVSAALGRLLARDGHRVLLLEVDPRENLHQLLEVAPSGGEIVEVGGGLYLEHLVPRHEVDALVRHHLGIRPLVRRVLASPIYEHFVDTAPGLKELAVLGHASRLAGDGPRRGLPGFDTVVLDAPASGHGVSLLLAPSLAYRVIPHGPFGRLAAQLAGLVADAGRCAIVVVTQAEEMPVQEAFELAQALAEKLRRTPDLLVVNGLYPPWPQAAAPGADDTSEPLAPWRTRRAVNERELRRVHAGWTGAVLELPLLPFDRGPELAAALAQALEGTLDGVSIGERP
jgi:Mrp family chromosome partitioning ATPase